jgi:hypothetical protein
MLIVDDKTLNMLYKLLEDNGCNCVCDHHHAEHLDDCVRCLACRLAQCLEKDDFIKVKSGYAMQRSVDALIELGILATLLSTQEGDKTRELQSLRNALKALTRLVASLSKAPWYDSHVEDIMTSGKEGVLRTLVAYGWISRDALSESDKMEILNEKLKKTHTLCELSHLTQEFRNYDTKFEESSKVVLRWDDPGMMPPGKLKVK